MQGGRILDRMKDNAARIHGLAAGIDEDRSRWKPDQNSWSALEVMGHLYDEERLDFRVRLEYTLQRKGKAWPEIDPQGWVQAHTYNKGSLQTYLQGFLDAREDSLQWLRSILPLDLEASYEAPFGEIKAGDLLAAWAAHDVLHMRQLVELHWAFLEKDTKPYRTLYAGEW